MSAAKVKIFEITADGGAKEKDINKFIDGVKVIQTRFLQDKENNIKIVILYTEGAML